MTLMANGKYEARYKTTYVGGTFETAVEAAVAYAKVVAAEEAAEEGANGDAEEEEEEEEEEDDDDEEEDTRLQQGITHDNRRSSHRHPEK